MNFIGSKYQGQKTTDLKRFHGLGQYTFPNGDRYVGGFYDGCFHGYGVIFYRLREDTNDSSSTSSKRLSKSDVKEAQTEEQKELENLQMFLQRSEPSKEPIIPPQSQPEDESKIVWQGQYRGIWEHGRNVNGCYVFADGLVYGGRAMKNDSEEEAAAAAAACADWPYCQCSDHRLWAEHLRNITPVLPYEAVFGGSQLQEEYREAMEAIKNKKQTFWSDMPILVPSSCEQEMIPSSFAGGQPRGGKDVAMKWWKSASKRKEVITALSLPTDPLVAEEDPDHYDVTAVEDDDDTTHIQLGRKVENPNLQIRYPINITDGNRTLTPCFIVLEFGIPKNHTLLKPGRQQNQLITCDHSFILTLEQSHHLRCAGIQQPSQAFYRDITAVAVLLRPLSMTDCSFFAMPSRTFSCRCKQHEKMAVEPAGIYNLTQCHVSTAIFASGSIKFYDVYAELCVTDRNIAMSALFIPFQELLYFKVVRANNMIHIALPNEYVWDWASENNFQANLTDLSSGTNVEDCSYPIALELSDYSALSHFLDHTAPLIAADRRSRSFSRVSVSNFIAVSGVSNRLRENDDANCHVSSSQLESHLDSEGSTTEEHEMDSHISAALANTSPERTPAPSHSSSLHAIEGCSQQECKLSHCLEQLEAENNTFFLQRGKMPREKFSISPATSTCCSLPGIPPKRRTNPPHTTIATEPKYLSAKRSNRSSSFHAPDIILDTSSPTRQQRNEREALKTTEECENPSPEKNPAIDSTKKKELFSYLGLTGILPSGRETVSTTQGENEPVEKYNFNDFMTLPCEASFLQGSNRLTKIKTKGQTKARRPDDLLKDVLGQNPQRQKKVSPQKGKGQCLKKQTRNRKTTLTKPSTQVTNLMPGDSPSKKSLQISSGTVSHPDMTNMKSGNTRVKNSPYTTRNCDTNASAGEDLSAATHDITDSLMDTREPNDEGCLLTGTTHITPPLRKITPSLSSQKAQREVTKNFRLRKALTALNRISHSLAVMRESEEEVRGLFLAIMSESPSAMPSYLEAQAVEAQLCCGFPMKLLLSANSRFLSFLFIMVIRSEKNMLSQATHTPEEVVTSLSFIACDGQNLLVSCCGDGTASVWDYKRSMQKMVSLSGHRDAVNDALQITENSSYLLTASDDRTINGWDLRNSTTPLFTLSGFGDGVNKTIALPHDIGPSEYHSSSLIASACDDGIVYIHSLLGANGENSLVDSFHAALHSINDIVYHEGILITASDDYAVRSWNLPFQKEASTDQRLIESLDEFTNPVNHLGVIPHDVVLTPPSSPEGDLKDNMHQSCATWLLAACSEIVFGTDFYIPNGSFGKAVKTFQGHTDYIRGLHLSKQGTLYTVSDDTTLIEWNLHCCDPIRQVKLHDSLVMSSAMTDSKDILATGTAEGEIRIWQLPFETECMKCSFFLAQRAQCFELKLALNINFTCRRMPRPIQLPLPLLKPLKGREFQLFFLCVIHVLFALLSFPSLIFIFRTACDISYCSTVMRKFLITKRLLWSPLKFWITPSGSCRFQSQSSRGQPGPQWHDGELDPRYSSESNMRKLNPDTMAHYVKATIQNDRREMGLGEIFDWAEFAKDAVYIPTRSGPLWVGNDDPRAAKYMRRKEKMKVKPLQKARPKPGPDPAKSLEDHPLREYFTTATNLSDPLSVANNLHRAGRIREYDIKHTAAHIHYAPRPPIVSIMGHVDHGKTTLLDYLRKSNVVAVEDGGITQNIGAFQVKTSSGSYITFIDTPGHAAFTTMRETGASATDIIILIVSAVDGVQDQTKEVISLAHDKNIPMVVAITKIDRQPKCDHVIHQLRELGLELEEDGGDVQVAKICAKDGTGIPELLDILQLQSELCEISTPQPCRSELIVLESQRRECSEVSAIVRCGTVKTGQVCVAGLSYGTIGKIFNDQGEQVTEATPAMPVVIQGFKVDLKPGSILLQVSSESHAQKFYYFMRDVYSAEGSREDYLQVLNQERQGNIYNRKPDNNLVRNFSTKAFILICKAATFGMLQALMKCIYELPRLEGISLDIRITEVGGLKDYDIVTAGGTGQPACILLFGHSQNTAKLDVPSHIRVIEFKVLYHGVEELKEVLVGALPKIQRTRVLSAAECLETFRASQAGKRGNAAGMKVLKGTLDATHVQCRVLRKKPNISNWTYSTTSEKDEEEDEQLPYDIVYDGQIKELRRFKELVPYVETGLECGVILHDEFNFKKGDVLELFELFDVSRDVAEEFEKALHREKILRDIAERQEIEKEQEDN
eukprot:gene8541-5988_t